MINAMPIPLACEWLSDTPILAFGEGLPEDRLLNGVLASLVISALVFLAVSRSKRRLDFLEAVR